MSDLRALAVDMLALVDDDIAERRWETDDRHPSDQWWLGFRQALADLLWNDDG